MKFLNKIREKIKGLSDKIKDYFKRRKSGSISKQKQIAPEPEIREESEALKVEEFERPRRVISPSSRSVKDKENQTELSEVESESEIFDASIDANDLETGVVANIKIIKKPLVLLDLKDGSIKLKLPVINFPNFKYFKEASPIICEIKEEDINNKVFNRSIELKEVNCRIANSVEEPILLDLSLFKLVKVEIGSSNVDLNKVYKYFNENDSLYIFQEIKDYNPYLDDLNKFFNVNDYFWIYLKGGIKINPKPSIFSEYVAYDGYNLYCISLDQDTNEFQIFDSDDNVLEEIYKRPQLVFIPKENGYVYDKYFDSDPIFSTNFSVKIECSKLLNQFPKALHIQSSGLNEEGSFHLSLKLHTENQIEITSELLNNKIGNYQINLEFYTDETYRNRVFNIPIRKHFRYCPITIENHNKIVLPTSENYREYPLLIRTLCDQELIITCNDIDINKTTISDGSGGNVLHGIVPINIDEIVIFIGAFACLNNMPITLVIPRIKWRINGLKKFSEFSGEILEINYEENLADEEDLKLEIKLWSKKWIRNCSLNFKDEIYPIQKFDQKKLTYSFPLDIIYDKIERYLNKVDDLYFSLTYENHEFPILKITSAEKLKKEKISANVNDPYVELDFSENCINLVIPEQIIRVQQHLKIIDYQIEINGVSINSTAHITYIYENYIKVEKKEIEIIEPLREFNIKFPKEFENYNLFQNYIHEDNRLYLFKEKRFNRARMEYLWDEEGTFIPIKKKHVLILHPKNLELIHNPDRIEDLRIWDYEKPQYVDLREQDYLILKNTENKQTIQFSCEHEFFLEGDKLDIDDYRERLPLFTGNTIEIKSPIINPEGWEIWIKNRRTEFRMIIDFWKGDSPVILNCPDDLDCESGEFQIKICNRGSDRALKSFQFRYIRYIEINLTEDLIIPGENGHDIEMVEVVLGQNYSEWELKNPQNVGHIINEEDNGFNLILGDYIDSVKFSVMKTDNPETEIKMQITVPRLKWKLGSQVEWTGKIIEVERKTMIISGEDLILKVNTNDFNNLYNIKTILKARDESTSLQELPLHKTKKSIYHCNLSNIIEILSTNTNELTLSLKIVNLNEESKVYNIDCLIFLEIEEPIINVIDIDDLKDIDLGLEDSSAGDNEQGEDEIVDLGSEEIEPDEPEEEESEEIKIDQTILVNLTHEVIRDNPPNVCINYAIHWLKSENNCKIEARGIYITRAVILCETLRNFYFNDLHYENVSLNTQRKKEDGKYITGIEISLNTTANQENLELQVVPNEDIGMYVGRKQQKIYLARAEKVLKQNGYCKIKARGRFISKTATICERLKNYHKRKIICEEIILYTEILDGKNISAIYIKIANPIFKKLEKDKFKLKIGKKIYVGNRVFEL